MARRDLETLFDRYRRKADMAALSVVFDRTAPELLRLARCVAGRSGDPDDLLQDTFLTAIEIADRWDRSRPLVPWLMGILVNEARSSRRRSSRVPDLDRLDQDEVVNPAEIASAREFAAEVDKALATLPLVYREVLAQRIQEGRHGNEIAALLGRPAGTVRTQLVRGLELLRKALPRGIATVLFLGWGARQSLATTRSSVLTVASLRQGLPVHVTSSGGMTASAAAMIATFLLATVAVFLHQGPEDSGPRSVAPLSAVVGNQMTIDRSASRKELPVVVSVGRSNEIGAALTGRVLDANGRARSGVRIDLFGVSRFTHGPSIRESLNGQSTSSDLARLETITEAGGRFRFEGLDPDWMAVVVVDAPGSHPFARIVDVALSPWRECVLPDILLREETVIRGRVVAKNGRPLGGARVRASDLPSMALSVGFADFNAEGWVAVAAAQADGETSWQAFPLSPAARALFKRIPWPEAITDDSGRFLLRGVPRGLNTVCVQHPDHVTAAAGPFSAGVSELDVGDISLEEGSVVSGVVRDARGEPIPNQPVLVGAIPPLVPLCVLSWRGRTDDEGRFVVRALRETAHLIALPRDRGGVQLFAGALPGGPDLELRAETNRPLELRVVGENREPLAGVQVAIHRRAGAPNPLSPSLDLLDSTRVGQVVRVELPGGDAAKLIVRAPGYRAREVGLESLPISPILVRLDKAHRHRVRCVDGETGAPIEGAWVALTGRASASRFSPSAEVFAHRATDASGEAELECFDGGEWVMRVHSAGFAPVVTEIAGHPGACGDSLDLPPVRMVRGGVLTGQVVAEDAGSNRVETWLVIARPEDASGVAAYTSTDRNGRYHLDRLSPGTHRVMIYEGVSDGRIDEAYRFASSGVLPVFSGAVDLFDGVERSLVVRVGADKSGEGTGIIEGRILVEGAPGAGLRVTATPSESGADIVVDADASGRFTLVGVPAGDVLVRVRESETLFSPIGRILASDRVEVRSGVSSVLSFDVRTGRILGRVVDGLGMPVPFAGIRLRSGGEGIPSYGLGRTSAYGTTGAAGEFQLDRVPVGSYRLKVAKAGYAEASVGPVPIPDHGDAERVRIVLLPAVEISGTVSSLYGETGRRPSSFLLRHDEGFVDQVVDVDPESGVFQVKGVAPGSLRVLPRSGDPPFAPIHLVVTDQGLSGLVLTPMRPQGSNRS